MLSGDLCFNFSSVNTNYCEFVAALPNGTDNPNQHYRDTQYGFPIEDDNELLEWLVLEANQAGLSWTLMLKKQQAFQTAFKGFDIDTVVAFDEADIERLPANIDIARNRPKVNTAIYNARQTKQIQQEYGLFKNWLDAHHPPDKAEWVKLFKEHFKSASNEIVSEFLMNTDYLPGAHVGSCPVYREILAYRPKWTEIV